MVSYYYYYELSSSLYRISLCVYLYFQGIDEESHLNLTPSQLECLVNCILNEAAQCVGVKRSTEVEGKVPEKQDFDV